MTLSDLYGLYLQNRSLIDSTWNFFVTVHMAIIGLVFLAQRSRTPFLNRLLILPPYAAFMFVNYRGQIDNYVSSQKLASAIHTLEQNMPNALDLSQGGARTWIVDYMVYIYGGAAAFAVMLLFFSGFAARKPQRSSGLVTTVGSPSRA